MDPNTTIPTDLTLASSPLPERAFLWKNRIPLQELTILESIPDLPIAHFAYQIAAHVALGDSSVLNDPSVSGDSFASGDPSALDTPDTLDASNPSDTPASVLIVTPNIQAIHPIRACLTKHGAPLDHVATWSYVYLPDNTTVLKPSIAADSPPAPDLGPMHRAPISLPDDFDLLRNRIRSLGARLVIFTHLSDLINLRHPSHSFSQKSFTSVLFQLQQLLIEENAAALVLCQISTNSHRLTSREEPLLTFATTRLSLLPDPLNTEQHVLTHRDLLHATNAPSLSYRIDPTDLSVGSQIPTPPNHHFASPTPSDPISSSPTPSKRRTLPPGLDILFTSPKSPNALFSSANAPDHISPSTKPDQNVPPSHASDPLVPLPPPSDQPDLDPTTTHFSELGPHPLYASEIRTCRPGTLARLDIVDTIAQLITDPQLAFTIHQIHQSVPSVSLPYLRTILDSMNTLGIIYRIKPGSYSAGDPYLDTLSDRPCIDFNEVMKKQPIPNPLPNVDPFRNHIYPEDDNAPWYNHRNPFPDST